jgi:hypothetical protein
VKPPQSGDDVDLVYDAIFPLRILLLPEHRRDDAEVLFQLESHESDWNKDQQWVRFPIL